MTGASVVYARCRRLRGQSQAPVGGGSDDTQYIFLPTFIDGQTPTGNRILSLQNAVAESFFGEGGSGWPQRVGPARGVRSIAQLLLVQQLLVQEAEKVAGRQVARPGRAGRARAVVAALSPGRRAPAQQRRYLLLPAVRRVKQVALFFI